MKVALRTPLTPVPHDCLGEVVWALTRADARRLRGVLVASGRDVPVEQLRLAKERLRDALNHPGPLGPFIGDVELELPLTDGLTLRDLLTACAEVDGWLVLLEGGFPGEWDRAHAALRGLGAWLVGIV